MKALPSNTRAHFDYSFIEEFSAGIELLGFEVRAVRTGHAVLNGSFVKVRGGEAFLIGASIPPYQPVNTPATYDPSRTRRLLLQQKEILAIADAEKAQGFTCVPLRFFIRGKHLKLAIAIAKGKKNYDKRESIKARDDKRSTDRLLKQR
jgi:SsrA-binding protein